MEKFPFPARKKKAHKGQHGKVLVVGGSERFHGAPILAALGAERSGVDLIFLTLPAIHTIPARCASLNFIVEPFSGSFLREADVPAILARAEESDVLLFGNGLGTREESRRAAFEILQSVSLPVVLDADGLFSGILEISRDAPWTVLPHDREFERLFSLSPTEKNIQKMAKKFDLTIFKTGPVDLIADPKGTIHKNPTGVPEMTAGGTGDALSGIVTGLIAQGMEPFLACQTAAHWWGKTGESLVAHQKTLTAEDLLHHFPQVLSGRAIAA